MNYQGQDEVEKLGYTLYCHNGDKSIVSYGKGKLCLTIYNGIEANLHSSYKMIQIKTGKFSFPNKNFHIFENQIIDLLNGVNL